MTLVKIFCLFLGLFFLSTPIKAQTDHSGRGEESHSPFLTEFLEKWDNARDYSLAVMALMPEDQYDFKPTDEQMTFREQVIHNMRQMTRFPSIYLGAEPFAKLEQVKTADTLSVSDLTAFATEGFAYTRQAAAALDEESLNEVVDFFAGPKTKRQVLMVLNDHLTHHRAQMIVYLRLQGIKPPRYVGW